MKNEIHVLIAEDEDSDFLLLQKALRQTDVPWAIHRVTDGLEALNYLRGDGPYADRTQHPIPQVVVLDLKMPRMTGMELLEWIKENPSYRVIPTLIMSSSQQELDVQKAYEFGANTYFVKPTNFQALVSLCRQIAGYWEHGVKPRLER